MNKKRAKQAYQALARFQKRHREEAANIGIDLGFDLMDVMDSLREEFIDTLEECGCCGCYHCPEFAGDCRDDDERF